MDTLQVTLLTLIAVAAASYTTAAIAYHILAPWHETRVGRWYMAQLVAVTACLYLVLLSRTINPLPITTPLPYVIYGIFSIVGIGTALTIITTQVTQARRDNEADTQAMNVIAEERQQAAPVQEGQDQ